MLCAELLELLIERCLDANGPTRSGVRSQRRSCPIDWQVEHRNPVGELFDPVLHIPVLPVPVRFNARGLAQNIFLIVGGLR